MNALTNAALVAGRYVDNDHMDGDWWWMMLAMMAFWAAVAVLVVWLVRGRHGGSAAHRHETADDILDRRLAEGSIDVDEHKSRRAALRRDDAG